MRCLFCDFVDKKRTFHLSGHPFKILSKTKNTISFLSIDIPKTEDGHVIVIPKNHFNSITDVPPKLMHELIDHVKFVMKRLKKTHKGCNILLNDGKAAGQTIMHPHFHLIPRNPSDEIKIEIWKRGKISLKKFKEMEKRYKKLLKK